ncbi:MAG: hypothetical protein EOO06_10905 [Chitinophagaceae bacterium]|nr:MAG: hypothetical protein EOO06_10905 [Chitinophagaceae bacterium]
MSSIDEIFQQKEWNQLSEQERTLLAGLADDEAGFQLIKQILLAAANEAAEVPLMSDKIKETLQVSLPQTQRSKAGYWKLAAAAAVVIMLIAALFIFNTEKKEVYVSTPAPVNKTALPLPSTINSIQADTTSEKLPVASSVEPAKKHSPRKHSTPASTTDNGNLKDQLAMNSTVADQPQFLDLITEAE